MKLDEFRKLVVEPLTTYCPTLNRFRIGTAYEDLQNTYALVQEFQIEAGKHDIFEAAETEGEDAAHRAIQIHSRLSTHFKALFIFADIFARLHSYKWSSNENRIVLVPMPEQFHIAKADASALLRLKSKYEAVIPNLAEKTNQYILLKTLFYGIPIGSLGLINDDRKEINVIAERGGCESLNPDEVIEALDEFAMAVVSVF